jgi:hypothetical protein
MFTEWRAPKMCRRGEWFFAMMGATLLSRFQANRFVQSARP